MEYSLVARVSYRKSGDYEDTVKDIELGDMKLNSMESLNILCLQIEKLFNVKSPLYYDGLISELTDFSDSYFYLKTAGDAYYSDLYKVELFDCLKIHDKLFVLDLLKPFDN